MKIDSTSAEKQKLYVNIYEIFCQASKLSSKYKYPDVSGSKGDIFKEIFQMCALTFPTWHG